MPQKPMIIFHNFDLNKQQALYDETDKRLLDADILEDDCVIKFTNMKQRTSNLMQKKQNYIEIVVPTDHISLDALYTLQASLDVVTLFQFPVAVSRGKRKIMLDHTKLQETDTRTYPYSMADGLFAQANAALALV